MGEQSSERSYRDPPWPASAWGVKAQLQTRWFSRRKVKKKKKKEIQEKIAHLLEWKSLPPKPTLYTFVEIEVRKTTFDRSRIDHGSHPLRCHPKVQG